MNASISPKILAVFLVGCATCVPGADDSATAKNIALLKDSNVTLSLEITEPVHLAREGWLKVWVDVHKPVVWERAWVGMNVEGGNLPDLRIHSLPGNEAGEVVPVGRYEIQERWDLYGLALLGVPSSERTLQVTAKPRVTLGPDSREVSPESVGFALKVGPPPKASLPALKKRLHAMLQRESLETYEWYYFRELMNYSPLASTVDRQAEASRIARSTDQGSHYHDVDAYLKRWGGADNALHDAVAQLLERDDPRMGISLIAARDVLNIPRHLPALLKATAYFAKIGRTHDFVRTIGMVASHRAHWPPGTSDELMAEFLVTFPQYQEYLQEPPSETYGRWALESLAATGHATAVAVLRDALPPRQENVTKMPYLEWQAAYLIAPPAITRRDQIIRALAIAHHGTLEAAVTAHRDHLPSVPLGSEVPRKLLPPGEGRVRAVTPFSIDRESLEFDLGSVSISPGATTATMVHRSVILSSALTPSSEVFTLSGTAAQGIVDPTPNFGGWNPPVPAPKEADTVPYSPFAPYISGIGLTFIDAPAQREGLRRYAALVGEWYDALEQALPQK